MKGMNTKRNGGMRIVWFAMILSVFLIGAGCSGQEPERTTATKEYNLIFISIDTLRADHLGCYGYPRATSPEIDKFAKENIFFKNFFTVVPKTGPSMTSFFTGRYMQHHGVVTNALRRPESIPTVVQILPDSLKKIAIVGNLTLNRKRGYSDGFDEYVLLKAGAINMEDQSQATLTPDAITWLKEHGQKDKFFLWLHYLDPHGPYTPPKEFQEMFVGDQWYDPTKKITLDYVPENPDYKNDVLGAVPKYQRLGNHDEIDYYIAQYDAEIRYTDTEIKKLFDYLRASRLWDSTIIVLTADHGEGMGENNYYFEHGRFVDDGQIHIPLIIKHPEVKESLVIDSLLESTDLAPTILSWYGLKFSLPVDGKDFSKLLSASNNNQDIHEYVYSCTPHGYQNLISSLRTKTGKFVVTDENRSQFFNLSKDKSESNDDISELTLAEKNKFLEVIGKIGKEEIVKGKDVKLPSKTIKALKTLGYTQ